MAADPNSHVASYMTSQGVEVVWSPKLKQVAFDWEIPRLIELLNRLSNAWVNIGEEDRQIWQNGANGVFSIRSCYEMMMVGRELSGPWKVVWYNVVPLKV